MTALLPYMDYSYVIYETAKTCVYSNASGLVCVFMYSVSSTVCVCLSSLSVCSPLIIAVSFSLFSSPCDYSYPLSVRSLPAAIPPVPTRSISTCFPLLLYSPVSSALAIVLPFPSALSVPSLSWHIGVSLCFGLCCSPCLSINLPLHSTCACGSSLL